MKKIQNGRSFSKQMELFMGNYDGRSIKTQIVKKTFTHSKFNPKKLIMFD
jgi:hypothetical protein